MRTSRKTSSRVNAPVDMPKSACGRTARRRVSSRRCATLCPLEAREGQVNVAWPHHVHELAHVSYAEVAGEVVGRRFERA